MGSKKRGPSLPRRSAFGIAGAALLVASGTTHLDLYLTGYRTIPTIGWMFLLQVIAAFVLAVTIPLTGSWLLALIGAGFALSTLGGYLLAVRVGLFGFTEVRTTAGIVSGLIDVAAFASFLLAAAPVLNLGRRLAPAVTAASMLALALFAADIATPKTAPAAAAALGAAAPGNAAPGNAAVPADAPPGAVPAPGAAAAGTAVLKAGQVGRATLLTNAKGFTLYWFAPDTSAKSACYGDCVSYWPPVTGNPAAGPGVAGRLGTITRTGGSIQATYDGHPLYTYIGDAAPGQANGNNLNLNGGLWHTVPISAGA